MIKQTITYKDFTGATNTEDFYFHLDKADLLEMQAERKGGMKEYMQDLIKTDNKLEILRIFRMFIMKSVGRLSEDGRRLKRDQDVRDEFEQTEAYQEFLFYLANDGEAAAKFLDNLMPEDLMEQVRAEGGMTDLELPADTSTNDAELKDQPEIVKEWTDFTSEELLAMDEPQFLKLVESSKKGGNNVPRMLVIIAGRRKTQQ